MSCPKSTTEGCVREGRSRFRLASVVLEVFFLKWALSTLLGPLQVLRKNKSYTASYTSLENNYKEAYVKAGKDA